jgi:hypothetical protein
MSPGRAPERSVETAAGTAVLLRSPPHLLALDSGAVERLVLMEEVGIQGPVHGVGPWPVTISGRPWVVWDLGLMLGALSQSTALVLLRLPQLGGGAGLALRTGPCIAVKRLPATSPIPANLFAGRPGAVTRCFEAAAALEKPDETLLGYCVEPSALWTQAELSASEALGGPPDFAPARGRL